MNSYAEMLTLLHINTSNRPCVCFKDNHTFHHVILICYFMSVILTFYHLSTLFCYSHLIYYSVFVIFIESGGFSLKNWLKQNKAVAALFSYRHKFRSGQLACLMSQKAEVVSHILSCKIFWFCLQHWVNEFYIEFILSYIDFNAGTLAACMQAVFHL